MSDEATVKRLRTQLRRLYDYADRIDTHSGIPWSKTPLASQTRRVFAETDPEPDGQQQLGVSPFPRPEVTSGYPLDAEEQAHVDRVVAESERR